MGETVKVLFSGAAAALALGLLCGQGLRPDMDAFENRPMGPQMVAGWAGEGSTGPFDGGASFAAYHGAPPDYVLGSDWKRAVASPDATAAVSKASYDDPPAAAPSADDPTLTADTDDTTVAAAAPDNPAREPVYDAPTETAADTATRTADEPTAY